MMGKIVRLHRQKGEGGKHSILDHVVGHKYKSETQRLCDPAVLTFASFCSPSPHSLPLTPPPSRCASC
jgi:hypothetical protein